ncbi:FAD/NAD(P)-binding oxidoreductase [Sulfurimonas sp.]|jgi:sulfide:quinone oxidoreductase|uniref:NAD(P)/FAD-dependent oxidoreductase n=1 Tax=Sulfurimonas sp. TaxID=2022749 RepID=UPI0025FA9F37|nr:FAD/NAD(P)-binding oxidoreductase [Sulfurimonas sp.]MBT5934909.1 NAD(P)/FAD-dependent oxidoreductase [Sulfurimonas sp.]
MDKKFDMKHTLSRREAIKLMGISPIAASVLASTAGSSIAEASEDVTGKVIIVGGGAGAIMALSRIKSAIKNPDITIVAPNEVHLYQPGQIFMGAGEMQMEDIILDNNNYIDKNEVTWIKDEVSVFDADNNSLTTRGGETLKYDYLVVATGIEYHYEVIGGLTKEDIGTNGIGSVYLNDLEKGTARGATGMWTWFNELKEMAKTKKPKVIYTQPNTPIKCGGAPQKMLYLSADYLKQDGLSADYNFVSSNAKLFSLPKIDKALYDVQKQYDTITNKLQHHLQSIDVKAKKATFVHAYEKDVYDEDFDTTEKVGFSDTVVMDYDFIHVVPPMSPVKALMDSKLIGSSGWLDVDKHTLQHKKYKNVFGIGDTCGIPMGKTGGSARHHGPILTQNLISVMKNEKPKASFDGYTVCPIKTQYGKIMMAEFNYKGAAPTLPLAFEKPRYMWWAFDLYMLKDMYKHLMLTGRF